MSVWSRVDGVTGLRTARYRFPGGYSRTTIVDLDDGHLAYSPGAELAASASELGLQGRMVLVAPSRSHWLGIESWIQVFPNARVVATGSTRAHLANKLPGIEIAPVAEAGAAGVEFHEVPRCRFGEVWCAKPAREQTAWLVTDMFMNIQRFPQKPLVALAMRLYGLKTGLSISRAARAAIEDSEAYKTWAMGRLVSGSHTLVPCHGEVLRDFGQQAVDLVSETF